MPTAQQVRVVIPARNEEDLLPAALEAVHRTVEYARRVSSAPLEACVTVVADQCIDRTATVAEELADEVIILHAGSVGAARAAGCASILQSTEHCGVPNDALVLCTDADSTVPRTWLTDHLRHIKSGAAAIAGTVCVRDWTGRSESLRPRYESTYSATAHHVHGANLSFTAGSYRAVSGFRPLAVGEDQDLVDRMLDAGLVVEFFTSSPVETSGRAETRATQGFGDYLSALEVAS